jgi:hypothetical protein
VVSGGEGDVVVETNNLVVCPDVEQQYSTMLLYVLMAVSTSVIAISTTTIRAPTAATAGMAVVEW